jgi:hypothetical protein
MQKGNFTPKVRHSLRRVTTFVAKVWFIDSKFENMVKGGVHMLSSRVKLTLGVLASLAVAVLVGGNPWGP